MRKAGFTLVEIIVVSSIIALVLSFVFPVLLSARKRARTVKCLSNTRNIGVAFNLYHQDNDCLPYAYVLNDSFPESVNKANDASVDWPGARWYYYLDLMPDRYAANKGILQCPSKNYSEPKYKYNVQWGNYGVNWSVCKSPRSSLGKPYKEFEGKPTKLTSLKNPAKTLLLVDSGYSWIAWFHTIHPNSTMTNDKTIDQIYLPGASVNWDKTVWQTHEEDARQGRHPGKTVNCLFTDGHTENSKAEKLLVRPLNHGQFGNRTPLWKP